MALINTHKSDTKVEPFKSVYRSFLEMDVPVPFPLELMSASAPLFSGYGHIMNHFLNHSALSRELMCAIRYHVAVRSGFRVCIEFNRAVLERLGMAGDAETLASEFPTASLPKVEQAILSFVSDALFRADRIDRARIEALKQGEVSEQTLFDAVFHGALLVMMRPVVKAFT